MPINPTPTRTPTKTPRPTPSPTRTNRPTPTPTRTPRPTKTVTPTPSQTPFFSGFNKYMYATNGRRWVNNTITSTSFPRTLAGACSSFQFENTQLNGFCFWAKGFVVGNTVYRGYLNQCTVPNRNVFVPDGYVRVISTNKIIRVVSGIIAEVLTGPCENFVTPTPTRAVLPTPTPTPTNAVVYEYCDECSQSVTFKSPLLPPGLSGTYQFNENTWMYPSLTSGNVVPGSLYTNNGRGTGGTQLHMWLNRFSGGYSWIIGRDPNWNGTTLPSPWYVASTPVSTIQLAGCPSSAQGIPGDAWSDTVTVRGHLGFFTYFCQCSSTVCVSVSGNTTLTGQYKLLQYNCDQPKTCLNEWNTCFFKDGNEGQSSLCLVSDDSCGETGGYRWRLSTPGNQNTNEGYLSNQCFFDMQEIFCPSTSGSQALLFTNANNPQAPVPNIQIKPGACVVPALSTCPQQLICATFTNTNGVSSLEYVKYPAQGANSYYTAPNVVDNFRSTIQPYKPFWCKFYPGMGYRWEYGGPNPIFVSQFFNTPVCPTSFQNDGLCAYSWNSSGDYGAVYQGTSLNVKIGTCPSPTPTPTRQIASFGCALSSVTMQITNLSAGQNFVPHGNVPTKLVKSNIPCNTLATMSYRPLSGGGCLSLYENYNGFSTWKWEEFGYTIFQKNVGSYGNICPTGEYMQTDILDQYDNYYMIVLAN